ncbi:hypothetical protein LWI28_025245 [Acer negundo]|uniref:Uncharacterized protein n=1 Tax=Acer negundo TaxID=4023 RepID=A0AAD5JAV3_ACENE|nr:hypothetical protein LWI28_025245 [Acer negundo]
MLVHTEKAQKHIAVFAFPFATHAVPLLSLVRKLSESAPDVNFSFFNTAQSNQSLFTKGNGFERIEPRSVNNGLPEGFIIGRNPHEPVEYFLKATPGNYRSAVAESGLTFDGLITDAFYWFAKEMAEEMRVPWVPYFTAGPRALLAHVDTDNIRARIGINGPEDETLEFLPGFSAIRSGDLPEGTVSGVDSPFATLLQKMGQMLPHASAVAMNSFEEIDPIVVQALKSRLPNLLNIGPFILKSPPPCGSDIHGCLEWLDQRPTSSIAYISFGSVITPPPHELKALAEALGECEFPFLWSFRGNVEEMLPEGAFFGEQKLNQRTVEAVWEFGVAIEGGKFTKNGTMKALNLILSSEKGKLMREKIGVLKQLAFEAVDTEGSSTANFNLLVDFITKL